ncbi:MAG: hypothetical protein AABY22_18765 [Nanoarchaeota archaeon]
MAKGDKDKEEEKNTPSNKQETPVVNAMGFGITNETRSKNAVPIPAPKKLPTGGYAFPVAVLKKVQCETIETKNGEKYCLCFYFETPDKERTHKEVMWPVDQEDEKYLKKIEKINSSVAHIYTQFAPLPQGGVGTKAANFKEYFDEISKAFNTNGKDDTNIFEGVKVWLKLTYYQSNLQFPYPNFIEKYVEGKGTTLGIDLKFDKIEQEAPKGAANLPTGDNGGFNEAFPAGFGN